MAHACQLVPADTFNLTELERLRLGLWQAVSPPATSLAECCAHVKEAWGANKAPRFNIKMPPRYKHNDDNKRLLNRFRACAKVCNSANGTVGMKLRKAMGRQSLVTAEPMVIEWNNSYVEACQVVKEATALAEAMSSRQDEMAAAAIEPYGEIVEIAKKGKRAAQKSARWTSRQRAWPSRSPGRPPNRRQRSSPPSRTPPVTVRTRDRHEHQWFVG